MEVFEQGVGVIRAAPEDIYHHMCQPEHGDSGRTGLVFPELRNLQG